MTVVYTPRTALSHITSQCRVDVDEAGLIQHLRSHPPSRTSENHPLELRKLDSPAVRKGRGLVQYQHDTRRAFTFS